MDFAKYKSSSESQIKKLKKEAGQTLKNVKTKKTGSSK